MFWAELSHAALNVLSHHQALNVLSHHQAQALHRGRGEQELKQEHRSTETECHYPYELSLKEVLSCPSLPPNLCLDLQKAEALYYGWCPHLKELNQRYCLISWLLSEGCLWSRDKLFLYSNLYKRKESTYWFTSPELKRIIISPKEHPKK